MFNSKTQLKQSSKSHVKPAVFEMLETRTLMSAAPQVMGFLPDYEIANSNPVFYVNNGAVVTNKVDWKDLRQVDYFSLLPNSNGSLQSLTSSGYDPSKQLPALVHAANTNSSHPVPVVVTVGGGDLGKSIPAMNALVSAGQTAWNTFASQIKTFCSTYGLAGVDLDWEPTATTVAQIKNFATLIQTIKSKAPSLKLSADVNGDPIAVTGAPNGEGRTIDAAAISGLNAVNVMAYYETPSQALTSMSNWGKYITGQTGTADVTGAKVHGLATQLQFGMEVDGTTSPAGVVEAKVDAAIQSYGGVFEWTLTEDTAAKSIITRIGAEIAKDTAPPPATGSVSGFVKNSAGTGVSGVTVFLDTNHNSQLDAGELHVATTSTGAYTFSNVPIGSYVVSEILPAGQAQTSPTGSVGHSITLTKGAKLANENFTNATTTTSHKLLGTIIAAGVSANGTLDNAFDGSLTTTFHGSNANGNWIGLDLGSAKTLKQIKFAAAKSDPWNMEGGVFQASNSANFSNAVNLYTVPNTSAPSATTLTTINVSGKYRYIRFLAPGGSFGDLSEIQFFGY